MRTAANSKRIFLLGCLTALAWAGCDNDDDDPVLLPPVALTKAKLLIEHNATDEDTGFQGFVDGVVWKELRVTRPDGQTVFTANAHGSLESFGLAELFFETQEPPKRPCRSATSWPGCRPGITRSRGDRSRGTRSRARPR